MPTFQFFCMMLAQAPSFFTCITAENQPTTRVFVKASVVLTKLKGTLAANLPIYASRTFIAHSPLSIVIDSTAGFVEFVTVPSEVARNTVRKSHNGEMDQSQGLPVLGRGTTSKMTERTTKPFSVCVLGFVDDRNVPSKYIATQPKVRARIKISLICFWRAKILDRCLLYSTDEPKYSKEENTQHTTRCETSLSILTMPYCSLNSHQSPLHHVSSSPFPSIASTDD